MKQIAIVMGSASDWETIKLAKPALSQLGLSHVFRVLSAHRTPSELAAFVKSDQVKVYIAAAGAAAHLAGAIASMTVRPVIGVPVSSSVLRGLDSLLSTAQMPPGVPVATVAIDGIVNAVVLAAQMLATGDSDIMKKLEEYRAAMRENVLKKDSELAG